MRKLLISAGTLVFVGALAVGATGAFFSDTETSTGNTFAAGALDLKVDDSQHYAGLVCVVNATDNGFHWIQDTLIGPNPTTRPDLLGLPCDGTWRFTDLTPEFNLTHHFFNFTDVKPGDQGENTVSLHVSNNAWACLDIGTNADNENSRNGPEIAAGDTTDDPNGGELSKNISVFAWLDNGTSTQNIAGDNIYQPRGGDKALFGPVTLSSFNATTTLTLADGGTGNPLVASSTNYIGISWCLGSTTVNGTTGVITCDGSVVGNEVQTDSATSTVQFRVQQARNNPNFRCNNTPTQPQTGGLVVKKLVVGGSASTTASDFTIHVRPANGVGDVAGSPQPGSVAGTSYSGLTPGSFVITEDTNATSSLYTTTFSATCTASTTPKTSNGLAVVANATSTCTVTNSIP